jgi:hypothetical protein
MEHRTPPSLLLACCFRNLRELIILCHFLLYQSLSSFVSVIQRHATALTELTVILKVMCISQLTDWMTDFMRHSPWQTDSNSATQIQSTTSHPIALRSILILSSHLLLGFPKGFFPLGFETKILCVLLMSHAFHSNRYGWLCYLLF